MAESTEIKLNKALAKLQEADAKTYAEICAKLPTVLDAKGKLCNIEAQLACVEEALAETVKESSSNVLGLENIEESKRDFPALFGVEPRKEVIKETLTRIPKNNGASHNGNGEAIVEADRTTAKKENLVQSVMRSQKLDENSARAFLGLKPKDPEGLTAKQASEYRFARSIGISENDAMVLAKLTSIKEVNGNPRY
jgi:hypothetical protein